MQILLVEDDLSLANGLSYALTQAGMMVNHISKGKEALYLIETLKPELMILDLGLPDIDGLEVIKKVRQNKNNLPILVLTARNRVDEKVLGLDMGADDYLAKPFEVSELLARLRVLERRISSNSHSNKIKVGDVVIDSQTMQLEFNQQMIELSKSEWIILKALMQNAGRVLTRDSLEAKLYRWDEEINSNALEVHIHHLRKKINSQFIKTIRGVGYTINKV